MRCADALARRQPSLFAKIYISSYLIQGNGQIAKPLGSGIEDCIGDGRTDTCNSNLADAARAHRRVGISFIVSDHINLRHMEMDWHMIGRKRRVHDPASSLVERRLLHQRKT